MGLIKFAIEKEAGMFDVAAKAGSKLMGNNILRNAAIGAGAGAVAGAANAGEGNRLSGALKGGALGGAVGGATTMGTNMYKGMKANPVMSMRQAASSEIRGIGHAGRAASTEWKAGREALKPAAPAAQEVKPKRSRAKAASGPLKEQVTTLAPAPVFDPKAGAPSGTATSGWHNPFKQDL